MVTWENEKSVENEANHREDISCLRILNFEAPPTSNPSFQSLQHDWPPVYLVTFVSVFLIPLSPYSDSESVSPSLEVYGPSLGVSIPIHLTSFHSHQFDH